LLGNFRGVSVYVNVTNVFSENTYVVVDSASSSALVVDPGGDWELIRDFLLSRGLRLVTIFNTHGHLDHVADNPSLRTNVGGSVIIHRSDSYMLSSIDELPMLRGLVDSGLMSFKPHRPDIEVEDGYIVRLGSHEFRVIHTPGHTMGSSVLYSEELGLAFTGDTVFRGTIGRVDLPHSNPSLMARSLERLRGELRGDDALLPGHGGWTRLSLELDVLDYFIEVLRG